MHVEAFGVAVALGPRHDMAGAQELRLFDPGQWAAAVPVLQEAVAEDTLADTP